MTGKYSTAEQLERDLAILHDLIGRFRVAGPALDRLEVLTIEALNELRPLDDMEWCTVTEAADFMQCTIPNVRYHIRRGNLPAKKVKGRWWVQRIAVNAYQRQKT